VCGWCLFWECGENGASPTFAHSQKG